MPTGAEALGHQGAIASTLDVGVEQISVREQVQFQKYTKISLAPDASVFWVATGEYMVATGALHYATDRLQDEDQTLAQNQVLLTAEAEISEFNVVSPEQMWIGSWPLSEDGSIPPLQVAFAQRGNYFGPANLWHYSGYAVYPALSSQIVTSAADLPVGPIVSNSLPIWLAQTSMAPVYPSFLVPDNLSPPYIVAHIAPERTTALGNFPIVGPWPGVTEPNSGGSPLHLLASSQLMRDEVTLTLYGFTNQMALQFLVSLIDYSLTSEEFGFANSPAISDAKRTQPEIASIAQKKTIFVLANYYQGAADAIARRLILSASLGSITTIGGVAAHGTAAGTLKPMTGNAVGIVNE